MAEFLVDGDGAWLVLPPFGDHVKPEPGWLLSYRGAEVFVRESRHEVVEETSEQLVLRERGTGQWTTFDKRLIDVARVTEEDGFFVIKYPSVSGDARWDRQLVLRDKPL